MGGADAFSCKPEFRRGGAFHTKAESIYSADEFAVNCECWCVWLCGGNVNMHPRVEFMERETFLIKVIRPRGEDSQSRNRYAHSAFIRTQSH